jgi:lipoyl(octanoyl) transferase
MNLDVLPVRTAGAAENMAADFLLLQRYPGPPVARFRHYRWRRVSFTFGYSQTIAFVRAQLEQLGVDPAAVDLCRRPTGGGMVDHREDWTYALVLPRGHALEAARATQSYRLVHEALANALRTQGVAAVVKPATGASGPAVEPGGRGGEPGAASASPGVCFAQAEIFDVIHGTTGSKIAGAAQKRNKHGLLFQGSIWQPATGAVELDWERFHDDFGGQLASALEVEANLTPWPEFNEDELSALAEQYASAEWNELR